VGVVRRVSDDDPPEVVAAHRWPDPLADIAASGKVQAILGEAEATEAVVLGPEIDSPSGPHRLVVIPLIVGDRCHGLLLADLGGAAVDLDDSEKVLLQTLGLIISAFLDKSLGLDELAKVGERKTEFIALASHELRTPIASLCGIAATLHERWGGLGVQERRGLLEVMHEQGDRLHRLVDQLLDLSRVEAASVRIAPTPLVVRERTEELVRGVAAERADEIELHIDPGLVLDGDADAFDRIVSNLITNALRYGCRPIEIYASARDRHFRLAVQDQGPGVAPELESELFDRFTRGDNATTAGTGLGLSIARSYARAQGGELLYQQATPHGARFELVMPTIAAGPG